MHPRSRIVRTAGWLATAALLAMAVYAPAASATETAAGECSPDLFSYSVSAGENPYPMLTVTVQVKAGVTLPEGCSQAFSLASYDTEGPTWPTSGKQTFLDFDTATISAANPSATLTVAEPACFGQTDFYLGSIRYDGIEGPLPDYPDSPTPYDKISGSGGGEACVEETSPTPTPPTPTPPTPTPTLPTLTQPTPTPATPTPGGEDLGATNPTPTAPPTGGELGVVATPQITPPSTDVAATAPATSNDGAWRIALAGIAGLMALALSLPTLAMARRRR